MINREQEYAAKIYEQVSDYPGRLPKDSKDRKRYGSMAHKLPILVRQAGLVQALEFVKTRKKTPYDRLLAHLGATVGEADVVKASREATDLTEYIYLTERVMLALTWYKRFAQSVLDVDVTDDTEGDEDDDQ